jgi:hypothetical protein
VAEKQVKQKVGLALNLSFSEGKAATPSTVLSLNLEDNVAQHLHWTSVRHRRIAHLKGEYTFSSSQDPILILRTETLLQAFAGELAVDFTVKSQTQQPQPSAQLPQSSAQKPESSTKKPEPSPEKGQLPQSSAQKSESSTEKPEPSPEKGQKNKADALDPQGSTSAKKQRQQHEAGKNGQGHSEEEEDDDGQENLEDNEGEEEASEDDGQAGENQQEPDGRARTQLHRGPDFAFFLEEQTKIWAVKVSKRRRCLKETVVACIKGGTLAEAQGKKVCLPWNPSKAQKVMVLGADGNLTGKLMKVEAVLKDSGYTEILGKGELQEGRLPVCLIPV